MQSEQEFQEGMLVAVSQAINELIVNKNFVEALDRSVELIGQAFNGDAFISELSLNDCKELVLDVKHHYMKVYDIKRLELNTDNPLAAYPSALESLREGHSFIYKKSTANQDIVDFLNRTGGKAGIVVPIYLKDNFWGILSLATVEEERDWSKSVLAVLETLAAGIGVSLEKIKYGENLKQEIIEQSKIIVENNRRYESLVRNVPGIVFRCKIDQQWSMEFISDYVRELTGYTAVSFVGKDAVKSFADIIHPNDQDFMWMETQRQLKKGDLYRVNYRVIDAKGEKRWFWEQGIKVKGPHGQEWLEGCIIDITDRVESHEKVVAATLETEDQARTHFSRELHDSLQQYLTTAYLNLEHAKKRSHDISKDYINNASQAVSEAIRQTREISHKLMPKTIQDYGYVAAVEALLESSSLSGGPLFSFHHNLEDARLPKTIALSLYRITQEAINNILKHAEANKVMIQLIQHPDQLILTIDDDGKGFDNKEVLDAERGFGLNNMINRATSMGAQMHIESVVGQGTHLLVELPDYNLNKNESVEDKNSVSR